MNSQYQTKQIADGLPASSADSSLKARSLSKFGKELGVTDVTLWRWRQKGWINPFNIAGRLYLSEEEVQRFLSRAGAGEFAQEHTVPNRKAA